MMGVYIGQYIPLDSVIHRLDARVKLLGFIAMLAVIIAADGPLDLGFALAATAAVIFLSRIPLRAALAAIRHLWLFLAAVFLMNALFYDSTEVFWSWWIFSLSASGLRQGLRVVLNVGLVMVLGNALVSSTAPAELTEGLSRLLSPLKIIRVPVEEAAMIFSVALQFIPILAQETQTIKKAQTARGARFESRRLHERALSFLPLVVPIFLAAFRRADELATAMEARGYRSAGQRTEKERRRLTGRDFAALAVSAALCAAQIFVL